MYSATEKHILKNNAIIANITKHPNCNIYVWNFLNKEEDQEWHKFYYKNLYKWFDKEKFPFSITQNEFLFCLIENPKLFNECISKENPEEYFEWLSNEKNYIQANIWSIEERIEKTKNDLNNMIEYLSVLKNDLKNISEV